MSRLAAVLRKQYGHLGITGLREIGHGLDARVYRGTSATFGDVALRVPHARYLTSGNETQLDTRRQLRQDFELSGRLRAHGLPVPAVFALHLSDEGGPDFTIGEFVSSDGGLLPDEAFGGLIRAIHSVPVPSVDLVCMESRDEVDVVLAERIEDRFGKLAALTPLAVDLPPIAALLAADPCPRRSLLHMDLRPENVLVRSGQPVAILDWANALIGDPALDLARAAEYGVLTPAALAVYGAPGGFTLVPATPRQVIYRLDTAVMLSHVFLDGAPDPGKARHYIDRVRTLCRLLG